ALGRAALDAGDRAKADDARGQRERAEVGDVPAERAARLAERLRAVTATERQSLDVDRGPARDEQEAAGLVAEGGVGADAPDPAAGDRHVLAAVDHQLAVRQPDRALLEGEGDGVGGVGGRVDLVNDVADVALQPDPGTGIPELVDDV